MSEVVQAEVVPELAPPTGKGKVVQNKLLAPYTGRRIQNAILKEVDERMEKGQFNFTLSTIARRYGLPPTGFTDVLHKAFDSPKHELHGFALEMQKRWAECEEFLYGKMLETAEDKGKWEGFATSLERTRREDWVKPSDRASSEPAIHIGNVEKLAMVRTGNGQLTTGD